MATILLTPMPMGMFLAFVPNGYLVFGGVAYYQKVFSWLLISGSITLVFSVALFYWLLSHNKALNSPSAGTAKSAAR
jgi:hypothetical protein